MVGTTANRGPVEIGDPNDIPVVIAPDGEIDTDGGDSSIPVVNPREIIIAPDEPRRGRGRPRGSKSANASGDRKQAPKEVSADLSTLLYSTHLMLAKLTKVSELELGEDEAKQLGDALARVQREFGVKVFDPKTAALLNLGSVALAVYVPRVIAHSVNAKKEREAKQKGPQIVTGPQGVM